MSIVKIKKQIDKFLETDLPEIIAIRGKWGVGKTFSWIKFLKEAKEQIKFKKYSYVSLFGVNSIETLKFSIFENVVDIDLIGTEPSIETFKANSYNLLKSLGRKSIQFFQGVPAIKNFGHAIDAISFLSVNAVVICIDDFERKSDKLSAKDILGLASVLKEQKKCKVVFILNDEFLDQTADKEYKTFREKVIDAEIQFNPTANECAELALPVNDNLSQELKKCIVLLGINNIRIIKKIEKLLKDLAVLLSGFDEEVMRQACKTATLLTWCYYGHDERTPEYQYIKKLGNKMLGLPDVEAQSAQVKEWNALLRRYNYDNTDAFDLEIARSLEAGWVDEELFLAEAKKLNDQTVASKSETSYREAWNIYHDSFDNNEEEVVKILKNSFVKNIKYISVISLNATVSLFRGLGRDVLADELIGIYIKEGGERKEIFNLRVFQHIGEVPDAQIVSEFSRQRISDKKEKTIADVLSIIAGKDSWSQEDTDILSKASVEEYYNLFKNEKGDKLGLYIDTCLFFGRVLNATTELSTIAKNAREALQRIAKESKLNSMRVSKYGIK